MEGGTGSRSFGAMSEKDQEFRGHSALLFGNKPEHPGKHLQLTSAFSQVSLIPHCVYGHGKYPALRTKKQSVRIKPLKSQRPYERWNRNQDALVPWMKHDEHSTEKQNLAKTCFQQNVCFLGKSYQKWWWQWNEKSKNMPVQKTLYRDRLTTILVLRE